jgi:hypothetical protein
MKFIQSLLVRSTLAALIVAVSAGAASAYDHDNTGYFDEHHQHHKFIHHNGHRGYWDHDKSGAKIFINV